MTELLRRVKQAATRKRKADEEYRAALRDAHGAGHPFAEIAAAAGTSRQRVRQLLDRMR